MPDDKQMPDRQRSGWQRSDMQMCILNASHLENFLVPASLHPRAGFAGGLGVDDLAGGGAFLTGHLRLWYHGSHPLGPGPHTHAVALATLGHLLATLAVTVGAFDVTVGGKFSHLKNGNDQIIWILCHRRIEVVMGHTWTELRLNQTWVLIPGMQGCREITFIRAPKWTPSWYVCALFLFIPLGLAPLQTRSSSWH